MDLMNVAGWMFVIVASAGSLVGLYAIVATVRHRPPMTEQLDIDRRVLIFAVPMLALTAAVAGFVAATGVQNVTSGDIVLVICIVLATLVAMVAGAAADRCIRLAARARRDAYGREFGRQFNSITGGPEQS